MAFIRRNLDIVIKSGNLNTLKEISAEVQELNEQFRDKPLPKSIYNAIKSYSKVTNEWAKQVFIDNSTCEVIDNKIEETIPWQIGTIKAYCQILLKNGCQQ